eukprot:CAMPEP_0177784010 /NCGR_PEP_ID=MMETSP0491_2-20121128/19445_1 /TAXON_ID=63592 /ORGANISM="Tetraselmis chuii, Strain PLY429" /LENGTH=34 /DNA_ID= /DNA_START= /DNA_END= /DNA_ORIENTATION=
MTAGNIGSLDAISRVCSSASNSPFPFSSAHANGV